MVVRTSGCFLPPNDDRRELRQVLLIGVFVPVAAILGVEIWVTLGTDEYSEAYVFALAAFFTSSGKANFKVTTCEIACLILLMAA